MSARSQRVVLAVRPSGTGRHCRAPTRSALPTRKFAEPTPGVGAQDAKRSRASGTTGSTAPNPLSNAARKRHIYRHDLNLAHSRHTSEGDPGGHSPSDSRGDPPGDLASRFASGSAVELSSDSWSESRIESWCQPPCEAWIQSSTQSQSHTAIHSSIDMPIQSAGHSWNHVPSESRNHIAVQIWGLVSSLVRGPRTHPVNRPAGLEIRNQQSMPAEEHRKTNEQRCNANSLSESRSGKVRSRMSLLLPVLHAHSPVVNPRSLPNAKCRIANDEFGDRKSTFAIPFSLPPAARLTVHFPAAT
jgi:hypothetical protein